MTDYLALLLEEQEREQERDELGVALEAGGMALLRRKPVGEQAPGQTADGSDFRGGEAAWGRAAPELREQDGAQGYRGAGGALKRWAARSPIDLELRKEKRAERGGAEPARPERGAERSQAALEAQRTAPESPDMQEGTMREQSAGGEGAAPLRQRAGAGWLYRRLGAGAAALEHRIQPRSAAAAAAVRQGAVYKEVLSPAELDRELERDARRYDGGFSLL